MAGLRTEKCTQIWGFLVFIRGFVPFFDGGALIFMNYFYLFINFKLILFISLS